MIPAPESRLIGAYAPGGPLGPPTTKYLRSLYREWGLDPRTPHPRLYASESISHLGQEQLQDLFRAMKIRREHRVLSLGEGNGAASRVLAKTVGCRVTGVDLNAGLVASARSLAKVHGVEDRVEYLRQDIRTLRLGGRRFDRLYANDVLTHIEDKEGAMVRALACLRPGAWVGIHETLRGGRGAVEEARRRFPALRRTLPAGVWFPATLAELSSLMARLGLRLVAAEDLSGEVAVSLARRLAAAESLRAGGTAYLRAVLLAHGSFLRYGRVIARKT